MTQKKRPGDRRAMDQQARSFNAACIGSQTRYFLRHDGEARRSSAKAFATSGARAGWTVGIRLVKQEGKIMVALCIVVAIP